MKLGKTLSLAGIILMGLSIILGFTRGNFLGEGSIILSLLWGKITLIDIYISFFIFTAWIFFRENQVSHSLVWLVLMMVFGSLTSCIYLFLAFKQAGGNWQKFWYGNRLNFLRDQKSS